MVDTAPAGNTTSSSLSVSWWSVSLVALGFPGNRASRTAASAAGASPRPMPDQTAGTFERPWTDVSFSWSRAARFVQVTRHKDLSLLREPLRFEHEDGPHSGHDSPVYKPQPVPFPFTELSVLQRHDGGRYHKAIVQDRGHIVKPYVSVIFPQNRGRSARIWV